MFFLIIINNHKILKQNFSEDFTNLKMRETLLKFFLTEIMEDFCLQTLLDISIIY